MRRSFFSVLALFALAACAGSAAEFWRPISEPNVLMPLEKAQLKLNFDLSQCDCGIFPSNVSQPNLVQFQPGQQRMIETGLFTTANNGGTCKTQPSAIFTECMRARGWEQTTCSGRVPLSGGGAMCAVAVK